MPEENKEITRKTTVINIRHTKLYDVYIGRPSLFGNPFKMGPGCTREQSVAQFEDYFHRRVKRDLAFRVAVASLRGKVLGCYCKQLTHHVACHGDVYADYLNMEGRDGKQERRNKVDK